jgi:hypothetical protein
MTSLLLSPALVLATVLSTACATFFYLWQRGDKSALQNYLLAAWIGFAVGHVVGDLVGIHWLQVGHLSVLNGTIGAISSLLIVKSLEA